jgi:hypothetical protein
MDKYRATLDAEELTALEQLGSVGKPASRKLAHALILLLADTASGGDHPTRTSSRPGVSVREPTPVSEDVLSPKGSRQRSTSGHNWHGRTRSREMSNTGWSNSLARTRLVSDATVL